MATIVTSENFHLFWGIGLSGLTLLLLALASWRERSARRSRRVSRIDQ